VGAGRRQAVDQQVDLAAQEGTKVKTSGGCLQVAGSTPDSQAQSSTFYQSLGTTVMRLSLSTIMEKRVDTVISI
jgi:hypothetical protein